MAFDGGDAIDATAAIPGRDAQLLRAGDDEALPPGTRAGAFVLDAPAYRGGFAVVYRAHHGGDGTPAAVKVMHRDLAARPSMLARFQQEAEALARLQHPAIVRVYDAGVLAGDRPYIAMEWLPGASLDVELARRGALSVHEALDIVLPIADALVCAHHIGIVHRDVKVQNIVTVPNGAGFDVKLVDFGIAKLLDLDGRAGSLSSIVVGTPLIMAPEQILGRAIDARTDIYALGVLLYHLVTGQPPFCADSATEIEEMHLFAPPPRPGEMAPAAAVLDDVVVRCMQKDPAHRHADVAELLAELRACRGQAAEGPRQTLYVLCETEFSTDESVSDDALDDADAFLAGAKETLSALGLRVLSEAGNALLLGLTLPADDLSVRERVLRAAANLTQLFRRRASAGAEVQSHIRVHAGSAPPAGISSAKRSPGDVMATAAVVAGLADRLHILPLGADSDLFAVEG